MAARRTQVRMEAFGTFWLPVPNCGDLAQQHGHAHPCGTAGNGAAAAYHCAHGAVDLMATVALSLSGCAGHAITR